MQNTWSTIDVRKRIRVYFFKDFYELYRIGRLLNLSTIYASGNLKVFKLRRDDKLTSSIQMTYDTTFRQHVCILIALTQKPT